MAGGPREEATVVRSRTTHDAMSSKGREYTVGKYMLLAAVAALSLSIVQPAASGEDIMSYAINKPSASWNVYGPGQTNGPVKDKAVIGGGGVRVRVTTPAPDQPWLVGAGQAVQGKIAKGDILMVAFWAKAEPVDGGAAAATISSVRVQQSTAPYGGVVEGGSVTVSSPEWKLYTSRGRALIDADKGQAGVSLQMAGSRQTVVLGPLFVLNFGETYDPAKFAN